MRLIDALPTDQSEILKAAEQRRQARQQRADPALEEEPAGQPGGAAMAGAVSPSAPTEASPAGQGAGGQEASPEEQQALERVVMAASELLYAGDDERGRPDKAIVEMVMAEDQVSVGIGQAAAFMIQQLDRAANGQIPEVVIMPAGAEIVEMIAEMVAEQRLAEVDEQVVQEAGEVMVRQVGEAYGVSQEEIEQFLASVDPGVVEQVARRMPLPGEEQQAGAGGGRPRSLASMAGGRPA